MKYDKSDYLSVIRYAERLQGNTLSDFVTPEFSSLDYKGKGKLGQLVEKIYFGYQPNSDSEPDFKEIGLELKVCPLKWVKSKSLYVAKEDLILGMINYELIVHEEYETSKFFMKNRKLLLVFYLHEKEKGPFDVIFPLIHDYWIQKNDEAIIKNDWYIIKDKIVKGLAHELSSGDTHYLAAKTKSSDSTVRRTQPNNVLNAKPRAFAFKASFVNVIIRRKEKKLGKNIKTLLNEKDISIGMSIEDKCLLKLQPFLGKTIEVINSELENKVNLQAKSSKHLVIKSILGLGNKDEFEEFKASNLSFKTMVIDVHNKPTENLSFPSFDFIELVHEKEWEESQIYDLLQRRYLFSFFKKTDKGLILHSTRFWTMPFEHRSSYFTVWQRTKEVLNSGQIVKKVNRNGSRSNFFPKSKEHRIGHVRPHGRDMNDTKPLPVADKLTGLEEFVKQSFWLNSSYIKESIIEF